MPPNTPPIINNGPEDGSGSREDNREAEDDLETGVRVVDDSEDGPVLGLCRQMCLCAGLMASDGGLVFLQLAMVPCLQTLGVPVSLVTVAGVISGALDLMALPLLGWVSDGGTNPRRRKAPAVVLSALVFVVGYSLVIGGCSLRMHIADRHTPEGVLDSSVNLTLRSDMSSSFSESNGDSLARPVSHFVPHDNMTALNNSIRTLEVLKSPESDGSKFSGYPQGESQHPSAKNASISSESDEWTADPLGMGIPLAGLLGILGFVFMDMGNDFNNSCQRSFILTCSPKAQHNSLFVVGVLMSALGGCIAAILGVLDIAAMLINDSNLDAVPTKTLLQCAFFLVFTLVCLVLTLCSAPSIISKTVSTPNDVGLARPVDQGDKHDHHRSNFTNDPHASSKQSVIGSAVSINGETAKTDDSKSVDCTHSPSSDPSCRIPLLTKNEDTSCKPANSEKSPSLTGSRRQLEKGTLLLPDIKPKSVESLRSVGLSNSTTNVRLRPHSSSSLAYAMASDSESLHKFKGAGISVQEKFLDQTIRQETGETSQFAEVRICGRFSMKKTTLKMILVCVSMFFMAGAWQSFNICATDYLGKVIYGGDPDADRRSQSYADYKQGITTGSLGVLMLNIAYVAFNLLQKKILALVGPKAEYLCVCGVQVGMLVTLQLTDHVMVFYTVAVVYGLFRSVMYTVPFMLANAICHQAAVNTQTSESAAKVGTTMGLMAGMMPLSFVVVSTFTGPLIHATGDPASPLYYATATTALAAIVFAFT